MADETRELDHIQTELEVLHERSQSNKLKMAAHEATCEERYHNILNMLDASHTQHNQMHEEIHRLTTLAAQGQSTIKTLIYVGTFISAILAAGYTFLQLFSR